jgi:BlaI family transcriptional regulator, penicillinase repressor
MSRAPKIPLSPLESRVMDFAWRRGAVTADDVHRQLGGRISNASVRTVLRRIEAKGFLSHREDGRTFVYEPLIDLHTAARGALRRLLDRFYGGSVEQLVVGLVDGRELDRRTLQALAKKAEAAEAADRRKSRKGSR